MSLFDVSNEDKLTIASRACEGNPLLAVETMPYHTVPSMTVALSGKRHTQRSRKV